MKNPNPSEVPSSGKAILYARFSSAEQATGDSERRQAEAALEYCRRNGLTLIETILDEAMSGFTGANRTKGKLLGLLERIQQGQIPRGTTLIVESFDRLSRQDALQQLTLFIELMKSGITLATLDSGLKFTKANSANSAQLFLTVASMVRGHEESKVKGDRVAAAWQNKRKNASLKPLTSLCPQWIELDRRTGKLVLIKERAKVIRLIFRLASEGLGKRTIARELNRQRIKTFGSKMWSDSYIQAILHNPAVLGIYQPYTRRNGEERKPVGEPVIGYYPAAITQEIWDRVRQKPKLPTGPRMERVTNLFTGLLIDAKSKSTFQLEIKDFKSANPWVYLRPRAILLGLKCEDYRIKYSWFEAIFFRFCAELDWMEISTENSEDAVVGETEEAQLASRATDLEKKLRKLAGAIEEAEGRSVSSLIARVQQYEAEYDQIQARREKIKQEADAEAQSLEALKSPPPLDKRTDAQYRRRLQMEIRRRIKKIRVYPHTDWSPVERRLYENTPNWTTFIIYFANGAARVLTAKNDNAKSVLVHEVRGDWEPAKAMLVSA